MTTRPPLTRAELSAIRERNPNHPDVLALLWEIRRLRALVLRTDDLLRALEQGTSSAVTHAAMLREHFQEEPVVLEQPRLT